MKYDMFRLRFRYEMPADLRHCFPICNLDTYHKIETLGYHFETNLNHEMTYVIITIPK